MAQEQTNPQEDRDANLTGRDVHGNAFQIGHWREATGTHYYTNQQPRLKLLPAESAPESEHDREALEVPFTYREDARAAASADTIEVPRELIEHLDRAGSTEPRDIGGAAVSAAEAAAQMTQVSQAVSPEVINDSSEQDYAVRKDRFSQAVHELYQGVMQTGAEGSDGLNPISLSVPRRAIETAQGQNNAYAQNLAAAELQRNANAVRYQLESVAGLVQGLFSSDAFKDFSESSPLSSERKQEVGRLVGTAIDIRLALAQLVPDSFDDHAVETTYFGDIASGKLDSLVANSKEIETRMNTARAKLRELYGSLVREDTTGTMRVRPSVTHQLPSAKGGSGTGPSAAYSSSSASSYATDSGEDPLVPKAPEPIDFNPYGRHHIPKFR